MWRFKPFMQKEHNGLEGRAVDVGNLKIHVRNAIAEGGFSCVYLARDAVNPSKQYALKHMICNDEESLEIVMKEISVMKSLKGHPNVVTIYANTIFDMGRTKEALLVMEFCEKSLVSVLESRGAGYFDEKQILVIFRDVCNAVFAMHCQSPPIAHRDLKAENLLLGSDGSWKLCDFGSTSTNHSRFERPEEMGIEEDNIRKYTTPAYRAPEMWDLYRRELINEKVDIWALGCLLFRICYFKSAFDGESKLQILNGNYRIPEMPKYSSVITDLIKDMLQSSPASRPDITQVWFRVNEQLPVNVQKSLPDRPPEMPSPHTPEGISKPANKASPVPHRSPPPPPLANEPVKPSKGGGAGQVGAFWSTQHAKSSTFSEDTAAYPKIDEESTSNRVTKIDWSQLDNQPAPVSVRNTQPQSHAKDFGITFFKKDAENGSERPKVSQPLVSSTNSSAFQDEAFSTFVAEFDNVKLNSSGNKDDKALEVEVEKLKEQLKQANAEKSEITSKYEKLSAICRSQRQELQELKQALAAAVAAPSPNTDAIKTTQASRVESSPPTMQREKYGGNTSLPNTELKSWLAFPEEPKPQPQQPLASSKESVRTRSGGSQNSKQVSDFDSWGFGAESFTATPTSRSSSQISRTTKEDGASQRFGELKTNVGNSSASQPAGWAGF